MTSRPAGASAGEPDAFAPGLDSALERVLLAGLSDDPFDEPDALAFDVDADFGAAPDNAVPDSTVPVAATEPAATAERDFEKPRRFERARPGEVADPSTVSPSGREAPAIPADSDLHFALLEGLTALPATPDAPALDATSEEPAAASTFEPEPDFEGTHRFEPAIYEEPDDFRPALLADWDAPSFADDSSLDHALLEGLPALPATPDAPTPHATPDGAADVVGAAAAAFDPEPVFARASEKKSLEAPEPPATAATPVEPAPSPFAAEPGARNTPREEDFASPPAGEESTALAFATDPDTESALRDGLSDHSDPQVWPGSLRTAVATLAGGHPSRLVFVDLDETPYPAGAIHELAAVCEVGTTVIALGSNGTARFSREILLAGVSDYLVKPVSASTVRAAVARAAGSAGGVADAVGWSVGFAGTGGSGATTLAAATALLAAERGRYVSVLDLNRTFPALSFLLDVEPAAGLVELLSTVARASLHPEMVDGMRAERSDRIAVYGYPWSAAPPPLPPVWAVCEMLVELQRRSHLVLVDGLDDPATRISLLAMVDARVLVVEPTTTGAASAARMLTRFDPMFDPGWPFLLVQNHTRAFKPRTGARNLRDAGVKAAPGVVVPFEPSLPAVTDRAWPGGRLPRSLRKPLAALADRILAEPAAVPTAA